MALKKKDFYSQSTWDEEAWWKIIAIEYESLSAAFDFEKIFNLLNNGEGIRLLDLGCGSAIFPKHLDSQFNSQIEIQSDLLDISKVSLEAAEQTMKQLTHFGSEKFFHMPIEEFSTSFINLEKRYHAIWAIHSFTTVELAKMQNVFMEIRKSLIDEGYFFIYQLTRKSSYQKLHKYYLKSKYGAHQSPYMEFEESEEIMRKLDWEYRVFPLNFDHKIPSSDTEALEGYLQKVVLDHELGAIELFEAIIEDFRDGDYLVFPQSVHLMVAQK